MYLKAGDCKGLRISLLFLTPVLTPFDDFFHHFDGFFDAGSGDVVIDTEDHFFICVAHPLHSELHFHASIAEHSAV